MVTGNGKKEEDNLLTVTEVAKLLRVVPMTVYRMVKKGDLPHVRLGRSLRFKKDEIEKAADKRYVDDFARQVDRSGPNVMLMNPDSIEELKNRGVPLAYLSQPSWEEYLNQQFASRQERAVERAKGLPPPPYGHAHFHSLYNEIRDCIIFGVNGAAITLSGILVEFALKYACYAKEVGGFRFQSEAWDEFENRVLMAGAISRAESLGLISGKEATLLVKFKDEIRNPYAHYNLVKITKDWVAQNVTVMNTKTLESETRDIYAKDDANIQVQVKPKADAYNIFPAFDFADRVTKSLLSKLDALYPRGVGTAAVT